ncbi:12177_t:CDS:1, partial [Dentiscutata erythropus]
DIIVYLALLVLPLFWSTNFQEVFSKILVNYTKLTDEKKWRIKELSDAINISRQLKEGEAENI